MSPGINKEYRPSAPSETYPADTSGKLQHMQGLWTEGRKIAQFSGRRIELGKEIYRTIAESKYQIGGLAFTGIFRGMRLRRNNVRNTPKNHFPPASEAPKRLSTSRTASTTCTTKATARRSTGASTSSTRHTGTSDCRHLFENGSCATRCRGGFQTRPYCCPAKRLTLFLSAGLRIFRQIRPAVLPQCVW